MAKNKKTQKKDFGFWVVLIVLIVIVTIVLCTVPSKKTNYDDTPVTHEEYLQDLHFITSYNEHDHDSLYREINRIDSILKLITDTIK